MGLSEPVIAKKSSWRGFLSNARQHNTQPASRRRRSAGFEQAVSFGGCPVE